MDFVKMHGAGNDFIVVYRADLPPDASPSDAIALCDRHTGIGADGVLVVSPNPPSMEVWNADGTVAEMCGNGLRCVVRRLEQDGLWHPGATVITGAGAVSAELVGDEVKVGIAVPRLLDREPIEVDGVQGHRVDLGNPHFVVFTNDDLMSFGPRLESHARFPHRTNVEQVTVQDDGSLRLRVWERGVGETRACGSGACAAAVVAAHTGRTTGDVIDVWLPGGRLRVHSPPDEGQAVHLQGPAVTVFRGHWRRQT
jgi:diaminopimelate epimerase